MSEVVHLPTYRRTWWKLQGPSNRWHATCLCESWGWHAFTRRACRVAYDLHVESKEQRNAG